MRAVVRRGRHQHVVAVGDHHGVGMPSQSRAQRPFDRVDLADAVQLVARQVQQHDHPRIHRVGHVRHMHFVHFERGQPGIACDCQRSDQAGVHIGALGVGGHRAERAQRSGGHPRGGRLAVGAGDEHRAPVLAQLAQQRAVQRHRDQAADHRAGSTAGHPRRPACGGPGRERQSSARRDHPGESRTWAGSGLARWA